jgi:hypothetical protein
MHSVGAIGNHNLGVFIVTEIAMENTGAVPPAHPLPRTPKPAYPWLQRCRASSVPLTCLAPAGRLAIACVPDMLKTPSALALTDHRQAVRPPSVSTRQVAGLSLESIIVGREPSLDQAYTGRLWTLLTVDYVDGDSLALHQARNPRALQRRSVYKNILAAPI